MFILLFLIWVILNGQITAEIAIFGVIISFLVCLFMNKIMHYSFKKELLRLMIIPDIIAYLLVLMWEIVKANLNVVGLINKGRYKISPAICHFKTTLKSTTARVVLANSITLTPGTITISLHDDELYVHCLDKTLAEGIENSVFSRRLEKMEKRLSIKEADKQYE